MEALQICASIGGRKDCVPILGVIISSSESMVFFHTQFVRPVQAQLQEMVRLIARFVARPALGSGGGVEDPRTFMQHP